MMITNRQELSRAIADTELKKLQIREGFSKEVHTLYESFTPGHILKNMLQNVAKTDGLGKSLVQSAAGIGAGFVTAKILPGKTAKFSGKILGTILKLAIAGIGMAKIKKGATGILRRIVPLNKSNP